MFAWCVQPKVFTFTFNMLLVNVKSFSEVKITFDSFPNVLQFH